MAQATKLIKVNGGDAFIEIGESFIRMGVGTQVFFTMDEASITGGAQTVNWQLDPSRMTYQSFLSHVGVIGGLSPLGPKYKFNFQAIRALLSTMQSVRTISSAVGIGI